jgi:hypothetical protein
VYLTLSSSWVLYSLPFHISASLCARRPLKLKLGLYTIWGPRFGGEKHERTGIETALFGAGSKGGATRELSAKMSVAFSLLMRAAGIRRSLSCGHNKFSPYERSLQLVRADTCVFVGSWPRMRPNFHKNSIDDNMVNLV